jgi:hypothetical protein
VDSHLKGIPGLRSLTTGSLSGGNLQGLGGEADGALDAEILGLGALNELLADLLEGGDLTAGKGDSDFVLLLQLRTLALIGKILLKVSRRTYWALAAELSLLWLLVRHVDGCLGGGW